jgi:hypothetical protein
MADNQICSDNAGDDLVHIERDDITTGKSCAAGQPNSSSGARAPAAGWRYFSDTALRSTDRCL